MITENEKKNREKLFKLMQENPDLPVVPMVDSEIVAEEGYAYWQGAWGANANNLRFLAITRNIK